MKKYSEGSYLTLTRELNKSSRMMSRDTENDVPIIDERDVETPQEKPFSKRLDLESENKTEIEKIKEELGTVSKKIFLNKIIVEKLPECRQETLSNFDLEFEIFFKSFS